MLAIPRADENIAIVRLSKVLSTRTSIVEDFLGKLRGGEICPAFDDLRISPVSLPYVSNALKDIACRKLPGIFHVSGASELSYAEFARDMTTFMGVDANLVKPASSQSLAIEVLFRPLHSALGMVRTRELLGIEPQPMGLLLTHLSENY